MGWRERVAMSALILAVAGAAPGCLLPPEPAECASAGSCSTCIGRSGCGWCLADAACRPGSSFGADQGACRRDQWRYASCSEISGPTDPCSSNSFCSTCRDEPECGWCFDDGGSCLSGTASGPSEGTCEDWAHSSSPGECYDLECNAADTCGECLGRNCYWCTAGGYCESSTQDTCDYDYEISPHDDVSCPPTDECYRGGTCETCTEIPGCVYCYDYNDILDRYTSYGCHAAGHCPTLGHYDADTPRSCPREL